MIFFTKQLSLIVTAVGLLSLNSCGLLLLGSAGAVGGYTAYKKGYRAQTPVVLRSPVTKEQTTETYDTSSDPYPTSDDSYEQYSPY